MTDDEATTTLTGRYAFVPNPCTTQPCLPGMAFAVECAGQCFLLTQSGRWSDHPWISQGWSPAVGNSVSVTGRVTQHTDIRGDSFFTIEVEALRPGE